MSLSINSVVLNEEGYYTENMKTCIAFTHFFLIYVTLNTITESDSGYRELNHCSTNTVH